MKQGGKSKDTAVLRTLINSQAQNFATKRLLKDLKQIDEETIPTVGVTARPLEHNLFIWHANIRGPEKTLYEGGILHLELQIPESYPHSPPKVILFTELPHPNVQGRNICLDMLQPANGTEGAGWSSAYTIQSVLLQLQSFLFEETISEDMAKTTAAVKKALIAANNYKCTTKNCKHGGRISLWPQFNSREQDDDAFIMTLSESQLVEQELICYHTKLPYRIGPQDKQSHNAKQQDSCLGILLNVSKVPRSGQLKQALPSHDYISLKAFLNEGIKWDSMNANYTHWMPLYFGKSDNKDRVMTLCERAISMIMTYNTRRFKPEYVLEVFPKITQTIVYQIMDEKTHASIRFLRLLSHVHALWLMFMEKYPQLYDVVEATLQNFIQNEKARHKDTTPNLGVILNLLWVSQKTKFHDIIFSYAQEQLDRQVFWLLKEIPEMDDEKIKGMIKPAQRVKISFKQQTTGFQMGCFQLTYLKLVKDHFKNTSDMAKGFEDFYCRLPTKIEEQIQKSVFLIFKTIVDYDSFYKFIGVKPKTLEEMDEQLIQAVENSKRKKYHGSIDETNELPPTQDQLNSRYAKLPKIEDIYKIEQVKVEDSKYFNHEIVLIEFKSPEVWRQMCISRWQWLADELYWSPNMSPTALCNFANERQCEGVKPPKDRLSTFLIKQSLEQCIKSQVGQIEVPEQTWEQLFIKLDFEEIIQFMDQNPNFQKFYCHLALVTEKLTNLIIPLKNIKNIQSGYHFITALIENLPNLLQLGFSFNSTTALPKKCFKAIQKGLNNLSQSNPKLQQIAFYNLNKLSYNETVDYVFSPLQKFIDTIQSLRFINTPLLNLTNGAKALGGLITNIKSLKELNLRQAITTSQIAKEITDGLMRAKQIQFVDISDNTTITEKGLASILYNLAFSPRLTHLNISRCGNLQTFTDVVESLFKLLRISASLEVLEMQGLVNINAALNKEFWMSLGEIKTLKVLNLNDSGNFNSTGVELMGKGVAFNFKKGGSLDQLFLKNCITSYQSLECFINNLSVSERDHENWYGDSNRAAKMSSNELQKIFYCNLSNLSISSGGDLRSLFVRTKYMQQYNPRLPVLSQFIQNSPKLVTLDLSSKQLTRNEADLLFITLTPQNKGNQGKIRVLNLSKNNLLKEGAKLIAQMLEENTTIEVLDISNNKIGVSGGQAIANALITNKTLKNLNTFNNMVGYDGAKSFAAALKVNSTIEFLELGHNRIRNKGLNVIAEAIASNPQSRLSVLGLRFNFLTEEGIIRFFRVIQAGVQKPSALTELYIKNNQINEYGLFMLNSFYVEQGFTTRIDLFQKLPIIEEKRLERTIWVHPVQNEELLFNFFQNTHQCGVVIDVRTRKGQQFPNRNKDFNAFNLVEFTDPNSITRALTLASKKQTQINGVMFRVYKAGTGTFQYSKKSSKQKKAETSKTNKVVHTTGNSRKPVQASRGGRGGDRGRGRGRGR